MDCLEECVLVTDVGAGCGTETTLKLGCDIGYDITVEVWKNHHLDAGVKLRIGHLRCHRIDESVLHLDLRILLCTDAVNGLQEVTICKLYDVGLRYDGDVGLAILACKLERGTCDTLCARLCADLEIDTEVLIDLDTLIAPDVLTLDVLAEEGPVDALIRHLDRTYGCEEVEASAKQGVCGYEVWIWITRSRCYERALHEYVTLLALLHDIRRKRLHKLGSTLDGHARDLVKLDTTRGDLRLQQLIYDTNRLLHDDRTDAIARQDADLDM